MHELFDLNGGFVFNVEPETGEISHLCNGTTYLVKLGLGEKMKYKRNGTVTTVERDTQSTFLVELENEAEAGNGNAVREHLSTQAKESRVSVFGHDSDGSEKRACDLVSRDGNFYLETKDKNGRKITTPYDSINNAKERLLQRKLS